MIIKNYHDLDVWKKARILVKSVYELTQHFPREERYGLTSQLQRAAVSVPCNIAEGHSRHGTKDYIHFVSIAIGSLAELDTQVILAQDLTYVSSDRCKPVVSRIHELQRMLHALRHSLREKCDPSIPIA